VSQHDTFSDEDRVNSRPLSVFAVVCPNGLGHFRRLAEVLHRLAQLQPTVRFTLVCELWQRERMKGWQVLQELEWEGRARWVHGLLTPGVKWSLDPSVYADGRLISWLDRLHGVDGLADADLVLSDNLPGLLALRSDAVLMGSFLWSDVLGDAYPRQAQVSEFVAWERELLARWRPPMLCVAAMAMPGVLERTSAVPLSWMRSGPRPGPVAFPATRRPRVALLFGDSAAPEPLAVELTSALLSRKVAVALPPRLYGRFHDRPDVTRFGFSEADYLACDLAVCRPGMGAIHDCVFHRLPMVLASEAGNAELGHNGRRVESLGIGVYLAEQSSAAEIAERVLAVAGSESLEPMRARLEAIEMNGIEEAAAWLEHRLTAGSDSRAAIG
jgi:hypothetical protein